MRVWRVAVDGLHGSEVLITHMKHLCTFPWSQMCWTVLQGGCLLILVPVLLQIDTHGQRHRQGYPTKKVSGALSCDFVHKCYHIMLKIAIIYGE